MTIIFQYNVPILILQCVLRQVHSRFQSRFPTECDLELRLSNHYKTAFKVEVLVFSVRYEVKFLHMM